jgi:hypothetical protein
MKNVQELKLIYPFSSNNEKPKLNEMIHES